MGPDQRWTLLPPSHMTVASSNRAFSMLGIEFGEIGQLMHWQHSSYPIKLFTLIRNPGQAEAILKDCVSMYDPFTVGFLKVFKTLSELRSREARCVLLGLGALLKKSTQRIECRHAAVRRRVNGRVQSSK